MSADAPHDVVSRVLNEIRSGDGVSLAAAGRQFPGHRGNGNIAPSTVWRWAQKGTRTADGRLIRLEVCRIGSKWMTSGAALGRFVAALTVAADPTAVPSASPVARTPNTRRKSSEHAARELERRGA
jgi:hypothetical protein